MPVTAVGLYEVVLEQLYFSSVIFNVFHYLSATADDDVQELCAVAFDEDLMAAIAAIQNDDIKYVNIRAKNLTGTLADFNQSPSASEGSLTGAIAADFIAAGFRYNRTTKETRNGAKRFSGLIEENMLGGGFIAAYNVNLDILAGLLGTQITTTGGVFDPIILRKPADVGGNWTYNEVANVSNLNRVTSQNSRKTF